MGASGKNGKGGAAARGRLKNKVVRNCADLRRQRAAVLLAAGEARAAICSTLGIHRNTLSGWLKDVVFVALAEQAYVELAQHDRERVWRLRKKAFDTIDGIMGSDNEAARARVALDVIAATGGLDRVQKLDTTKRKYQFLFATLRSAAPQVPQLPAPKQSNEPHRPAR